jgi:hypothetical protein
MLELVYEGYREIAFSACSSYLLPMSPVILIMNVRAVYQLGARVGKTPKMGKKKII